MPLTLKNTTETNEINENNFGEYCKKLYNEISQSEPNLVPEWLDKNYDFVSFAFRVLTPAFENYLVEKFKKKWVNLYNDKIQPDEKFIFPDGIKSWIKYFNEFLSDINNWKIKIQLNTWDRDFNKEMSVFKKLKRENQIKIFKIIYYGMYNFSPLARVLRTTVIQNTKKELDKLKNK